MKPPVFCFTLFAIIFYLTSSTLNTAAVASQPAWGNGAHLGGVVDGPADTQHSHQSPNRHYAQSAAANLNAANPYTVRLVYFLPSDRAPVPDIDTKLDTLIKNVQKFYADEMECHGFGRKTFTFEADAAGNARVHRLNGQFASSYYSGAVYNVLSEVTDLFDISKNINVVVVDGGWYGTDQAISDSDSGGSAFVYIDRDRFDTPHYLTTGGGLGYVTAHELGHVFGLAHDFRDPAHIMAYIRGSSQRLSRCNAEWLEAVRYFNSSQTSFNEPTTIRMLPPLLSPPNAIRLRFEISDADGLHQAQLSIPAAITDPSLGANLQDCESLSGQSDTIEFITTAFTPNRNTAWLSVIDVYGNTTSEYFPIDTNALLPAEFVVSMPDANLALAVREALRLAPSDAITQLAMLDITRLRVGYRNIVDLTGLEHALSLSWLDCRENKITDISPLAPLTNLIRLNLFGSNVSDISVLAGLTNLASLNLFDNDVSDISVLAGLTNLIELNLLGNNISDISVLAGLTDLTLLNLSVNNISDISVLAGLTNLTSLDLWGNNVSDISALAGLTNLTRLGLSSINVSDISVLVGLTNLTSLYLSGNNISDISAVAGLTSLIDLSFQDNLVSDISVLAGLSNLRSLYLHANNISDLSSLVANAGLGSGDLVIVEANPLSYQSIHTYIPTLQSRGVTVEFDNRTPTPPLKILGDNQQGVPGAILEQPFVVEVLAQDGGAFAGVPVTFAITEGGGTLSVTNTITDDNGRAQSTLTLGSDGRVNAVRVTIERISESVTFTALAEIEFNLSVPVGIGLIHVPLKVTAVDGVARTIESIADVYDALGGANAVKLLLTLDSQTQEAFPYVLPSDRGTPADRELTDDMGIFADMRTSVLVRLTGGPLGTNGSSTITLNPELNFVGLPLNDSRLTHVSDLFTLEGIGGNAPVVIFTDNGEIKVVTPEGGADNIPLTGGQAFILDAQRAATVSISGDAWTNASGAAAAPLLSLKGIELGDTIPVLALRGSIVDEVTGSKVPNFRVTVKNLSTGRAVAAITVPDEAGYQLAIVDIEMGRAATVGDILEISAHSPNPFMGMEPLRYTVTAEDVKQSWIQLPELVAYEIPAETELLSNYPNPFNPETWIPYRLAEDAFVTLTIYDLHGQVVRTLDVGHQVAAVYEGRSKAVYWDGRNGLGEQVASSVYFYHLSAGDYSATRKMVILK